MNRAQVLDAWRLDHLRRQNQAAALRAAACAWVAQHPELCDDDGSPCSYAIAAALHYKRLGGHFDADVVRRHRDMTIARMNGAAA